MKMFYNSNNSNNSNNSFIKNIPEQKKLITFSTCWYILKSKFSIKQYLVWIKNFLSIVNNFNLVIYTNQESFKFIAPLINRRNTNIKVIIKPIEEFYTYKYKDFWIKNHKMSNMDLHKRTDWKLNMLWNEKVFFVQETIKNQYFSTLYYGWCDIGYFRNKPTDLHTYYLKDWPNNNKLMSKYFKKICIHYACVQNDTFNYWRQQNDIKTHYNNNLKTNPNCNHTESCFAGGFFIMPIFLSNHYAKIYDDKLNYYFSNDFFIKDDQIIVKDIIFTNEKLFDIHKEDNKRYDNWFMFQRLLI
jgi:hypothetical protein